MNGPNYLDRKSSKKSLGPNYLDSDTGVDWRQHENDIAERSGGYRRAASGAAPGKPGDTIDQIYLREGKATKGAGITIKGSWLAKISGEALPRYLTPVLELRLEGQEPPTPRDWVVIPAQDFENLNNYIRDRS